MTLRRLGIALIALLALAVGIDNMQRPLANPDEGRYSEISREMAATGDWVTPRLNGIKYFEKPPLQYWATALAYRAFGEHNFTSRLYTAACGLLALLAAAFTAWRLVSPAAALATAAVLLSSPYFLGLGGVVTLDMGLTAWTTVAVCAFLLGLAGDPAHRRRWLLVAWAGMALAVLSKGLIGIVFPGAAVFLYCLTQRDWRLLGKLEWALGPLVFLAIVVPWFALVSAANPEFAQFFFVHEHFERFLTKAHRREEPWWFFWPILFAGFLPWALTLVPAALAGWREPAGDGFAWRRFALLWCAFILVFFSASGSKLPAYILPVFPVFAIVLGDWLVRVPAQRLWKPVAILAPVVLAGVAFAWGQPDRVKDAWTRGLYEAARPAIVSGLVALTAGLAAGGVLLRAGRKEAAAFAIVAAALVFVDRVEDGYHALSPRQSGERVAAQLRKHLTPATRVYSVQHYEQSVPYYIGRTVTLVDYWDEFSTGLKAEPGLSLPTVEAFAADWMRPGDAMAIIQPDAYERFRAGGLPMTLLHRDERRALVKKP